MIGLGIQTDVSVEFHLSISSSDSLNFPKVWKFKLRRSAACIVSNESHPYQAFNIWNLVGFQGMIHDRTSSRELSQLELIVSASHSLSFSYIFIILFFISSFKNSYQLPKLESVRWNVLKDHLTFQSETVGNKFPRFFLNKQENCVSFHKKLKNTKIMA